MTATESTHPITDHEAVASAVFLDLDTALLAAHQGRRGIELGVQADLPDSLDRLREIAEKIVVLVDPPPPGTLHGLDTGRRLEVLREALGKLYSDLLVATCPHGEDRTCSCAKPDSGLIEIAMREHGIGRRNSWHIGRDQEGVQAGRSAGIRTIRLGPVGEDHLSAVHRADYEARDLLDAANRIMLESLTLT